MSFELKTEILKAGDQDILVFFMRVNSTFEEDWYNCAGLPSMFEGKLNAWLTIKPTIIALLNACYNEPNVGLT